MIEAVKARLLITTIRDINQVSREKLAELFDLIDRICNRFMEKREAIYQMETIKIRFCEHLKTLGLVDERILGMKEINMNIPIVVPPEPQGHTALTKA